MSKTNILNKYKEYSLLDRDLELIAKNLAIGFKGYPLFEYFSDYKYSIEKMIQFWKVDLKTNLKKTIIFSDSEQLISFALLSPYKKDDFSMKDYIKNGGLLLPLKIGAKPVKRMTSFEKIANEVKDKYASNNNCWYLYTFVTLPEFRGKGYGKKVMKQVCNFLDEHQQNCYLETFLEINIDIYKKYGFELMEKVPIKNTNLTICALLRKHRSA